MTLILYSIKLPSLEEIAAMDRQREEAIAALKIIDNKAICQRCSQAIPIAGKLTKSKNESDRVLVLQRRISYLENHFRGINTTADIIKAKEELVAIQAEDAKLEKLRSLPLYSAELLATSLCVLAAMTTFSKYHKKKERKRPDINFQRNVTVFGNTIMAFFHC